MSWNLSIFIFPATETRSFSSSCRSIQLTKSVNRDSRQKNKRSTQTNRYKRKEQRKEQNSFSLITCWLIRSTRVCHGARFSVCIVSFILPDCNSNKNNSTTLDFVCKYFFVCRWLLLYIFFSFVCYLLASFVASVFFCTPLQAFNYCIYEQNGFRWFWYSVHVNTECINTRQLDLDLEQIVDFLTTWFLSFALVLYRVCLFFSLFICNFLCFWCSRWEHERHEKCFQDQDLFLRSTNNKTESTAVRSISLDWRENLSNFLGRFCTDQKANTNQQRKKNKCRLSLVLVHNVESIKYTLTKCKAQFLHKLCDCYWTSCEFPTKNAIRFAEARSAM